MTSRIRRETSSSITKKTREETLMRTTLLPRSSLRLRTWTGGITITSTSWVENDDLVDVNMFKEKDDINGAQTLQRQDKNERLQIPDLDIRMLDLILQEGNESSFILIV
jgi:hypothetical protein